MTQSQLLARGLKLTHLRLLASLARTGQISISARELGLTQPATSRLLAETGQIAGIAVHRRSGRGIALTEAGFKLAARARRALQEIADASRDIAESSLGLSGQVRLGSVTGPAVQHVLPVLRAARIAAPELTISVEVATSDHLVPLLLDGTLDFAIARLRPDDNARQFDAVTIATEPVSLVVREGHPLLGQAGLTAADLTTWDWVMPFDGTILHKAVLEALRRNGLNPPARRFSTSSFLLTLALVRQTNAIAPIASAVAALFSGPDERLRLLDAGLSIEVESCALLRRSGQQLTPAAQRVFDMLRVQTGLT